MQFKPAVCQSLLYAGYAFCYDRKEEPKITSGRSKVELAGFLLAVRTEKL